MANNYHHCARNSPMCSNSNSNSNSNNYYLAHKPRAWYNKTTGDLKRINMNVITNPLTGEAVNISKLDTMVLDQNGSTRRLYHVNDIRLGMDPRRLTNNIKNAIIAFVRGSAATKIQGAAKIAQAKKKLAKLRREAVARNYNMRVVRARKVSGEAQKKRKRLSNNNLVSAMGKFTLA